MLRFRSLAGLSAAVQAALGIDAVRCTGSGKRGGSDLSAPAVARSAEAQLRLRGHFTSGHDALGESQQQNQPPPQDQVATMRAQIASNAARLNALRQLTRAGPASFVHLGQQLNVPAAPPPPPPRLPPTPLQLQQRQAGPSAQTPQLSVFQAHRQRVRQQQQQRDHRQGRDFSSEADFPCHSIGQRNVVCPHCNAHHWPSER